jgi:hypothetical protein
LLLTIVGLYLVAVISPNIFTPPASNTSCSAILKSRGINRILKDGCAQLRLDAIGQHEVYFATKQVFQKKLNVRVGVKCLRIQFDNKVQIAVVRCFASGCRTEQTQSPYAQPPQELTTFVYGVKDLIAGSRHDIAEAENSLLKNL